MGNSIWGNWVQRFLDEPHIVSFSTTLLLITGTSPSTTYPSNRWHRFGFGLPPLFICCQNGAAISAPAARPSPQSFLSLSPSLRSLPLPQGTICDYASRAACSVIDYSLNLDVSIWNLRNVMEMLVVLNLSRLDFIPCLFVFQRAPYKAQVCKWVRFLLAVRAKKATDKWPAEANRVNENEERIMIMCLLLDACPVAHDGCRDY